MDSVESWSCRIRRVAACGAATCLQRHILLDELFRGRVGKVDVHNCARMLVWEATKKGQEPSHPSCRDKACSVCQDVGALGRRENRGLTHATLQGVESRS